MHTVRIDGPLDWQTCNVYPLADWHIGDIHCSQAEIDAQIEMVKSDPYGLVVLNGDLMNTAVRSSVSDIYGEQMKPMEQILHLVGLLKPIADRIICATTGNHEERIYRDDGVDIMRLVCRELGIEDRYHPDGVLVFLRFGSMRSHKGKGYKDGVQRRLFTLYATHGAGAGRKEGAKAIRMADMAATVDADVYIHSHSHLPMVFTESYFRVNTWNSSAQEVEKLFVNTGASLAFGGYGQRKEFKPNSRRNPIIHLCAHSGVATATL